MLLLIVGNVVVSYNPPLRLHAGPEIPQQDQSPTDLLWNEMLREDGNPRNVSMIKRFLQQGVDIESKNDTGHTFLTDAILMQENPEIIKSFLNAGACVNQEDDNGNLPLLQAFNQYMITVDDLDRTKNQNSLQTMKLLLKRGSYIFNRNCNNESFVDEAIKFLDFPDVFGSQDTFGQGLKTFLRPYVNNRALRKMAKRGL